MTARLLAVLALLGASGSAEARPRRIGVATEAQADINHAQKLFRDGDYKGALEAFRGATDTLEASDLEIPVAIYRSVALCYDQLGEMEAAAAYYKRFLALVDRDEEVYAKVIRQSEKAVERLEGVLERTALKLLVEPSGAEVRLDGRSLGVVPAEPVKVSPGKHQVSVSAPGYETVSFELEAAGGAVIPLVVHLAPSDRPRAGAGPPGGGATQAPAWPALALGAVAVGAAAGATWGLLAASDLEAEGDAITGRTDHSSPEWEHERPKAQEKYDQAAARRNLALGLGVAALAAGGVAAWLFVSAGEGDEVDPWESTAALGVAPAPDGGLVTAAWRF